MTVLVTGATGATGHLLVEQLLSRDIAVKAIVRSPEKLPDATRNHELLSILQANVLDLSDAELAEQIEGCDGAASCLGHNMSFKGIYGQPRRLVTDSVARIYQAAVEAKRGDPVKFVLMNTTGNRNRDLEEKRTIGEMIAVGLLRALLPPHPDNEQAAEFLRSRVGANDSALAWVAVRPDSLIDAAEVSEYTIHPSPIRSPIFNAGKTSRINVAHFMARLLSENELWEEWRGRMPVIYNTDLANGDEPREPRHD